MSDERNGDALADGDPLAGIGVRAAARSLDWVILFAVALVIGLAAVGGDPDGEVPVWATLSSLIFVLVYEAAMVAWRGQTIGKMVLGIEIVALADGSRPGILAAALRVTPVVVLLAVLAQFAYIVLVFVYFSAAFMSESRGVLDRLAATVVIKSRP